VPRKIGATVPLDHAELQRLAQSAFENAPPVASLLIFSSRGVAALALGAEHQLVIGRGIQVDLHIDDPALSRAHVRFFAKEGRVFVEDLESTNGTFVNEQEIDTAELRIGDEVTLGGVLVVVHGPEDPTVPETHDALYALLEHEVMRARFFSRSASVIFVCDPREKARHVAHWMPQLRDRLRAVDHVAVFGPHAVELLLPECDETTAQQLAQRIVDEAGDDVVLRCGVACFPRGGTNADELLASARSAANKATDANAVQLSESQDRRLHRSIAPETESWIAASPQMKQLKQLVARAAPSDLAVLIRGETGAGKELVARALHDQSPRKSKPMVCINCAAIAAGLLESTLFGHERGAFSGAERQHRGVFEEADGGTVFLDEIGELPEAAQAALLRVLETKQLNRVGSNKSLTVDVRIVAATHRDLDAMVAQREFRQDLLFRLDVLTLDVPPLRERAEDIRVLLAHFLSQAAQTSGRALSLSSEAMQTFADYPWPGNVRELKNVIDRAMVIADADEITIRDLPERMLQTNPRPCLTTGASSAEASAEAIEASANSSTSDDTCEVPVEGTHDNVTYREQVREFEIELLLSALRKSGGNQTLAAKQLDLPLRTFVHKVKNLGVRDRCKDE